MSVPSKYGKGHVFKSKEEAQAFDRKFEKEHPIKQFKEKTELTSDEQKRENDRSSFLSKVRRR